MSMCHGGKTMHDRESSVGVGHSSTKCLRSVCVCVTLKGREYPCSGERGLVGSSKVVWSHETHSANKQKIVSRFSAH